MYPSIFEGTRFNPNNRVLRRLLVGTILLLPCLLNALPSSPALGQAGRRSNASVQGGVLLSVVAKRDRDSGAAINGKQVAVFDNGIQQDIRNFSRDPSPARIVLLVDN